MHLLLYKQEKKPTHRNLNKSWIICFYSSHSRAAIFTVLNPFHISLNFTEATKSIMFFLIHENRKLRLRSANYLKWSYSDVWLMSTQPTHRHVVPRGGETLGCVFTAIPSVPGITVRYWRIKEYQIHDLAKIPQLITCLTRCKFGWFFLLWQYIKKQQQHIKQHCEKCPDRLWKLKCFLSNCSKQRYGANSSNYFLRNSCMTLCKETKFSE